jgi:uncharacterized UPF0160 family protein
MTSSTKTPRSFGTHDGTFHADEVTACGLLLLFQLIDRDKIFRTRNLAILHSCDYVCDVGGVYDPEQKLFDHHQIGYQGNLSSAGMILLYLKEIEVIHPKAYDFFRDSLIAGVDAHDNGGDPQIRGLCTYSHIISNFTPIVHNATADSINQAYMEALDFAVGHLTRLWNRYQYIQSCRQIVAEVMARDKECLIFETAIPWLEIFFELGGEHHSGLFVIMPSGKHWKLRGIPPTYQERMKVRMPLPLEWAGQLDHDLKNVSNIPGAIFCHKGRFISVWETKDDALKALEYTLSRKEELQP